MNLKEALVLVQRDLDNLAVAYAIVGGLAVSARAEPRMTRDIDLAVAVAGDAEAEELIFRLTQLGYTVKSVLEQAAVGRLSTTRLHPPTFDKSGIILDLLFASSGIEPEVVEAADDLLVLAGVTARVATVGHLIALKLLSQGASRPQDAADLVRLIGIASENDLAITRNAVASITARGFHRGRDLELGLGQLLQLSASED